MVEALVSEITQDIFPLCESVFLRYLPLIGKLLFLNKNITQGTDFIYFTFCFFL